VARTALVIVPAVSLTIAPVGDDLVALPERGAAELAGLSLRQLRYWAATDLVVPSILGIPAERGPRLYRFRDAVELLAGAALRERFTLQHVRRVVAHLRRAGYEHPLAELRFAVQGEEIYFLHPDGTWEGDRHPNQALLQHVVPLDELRDRIRLFVTAGRDRSRRGHIERRPGVLGRKPAFAGTRTPVAALFPYLERRASVERILEAFPHLTRADVTLARQQWRATAV